MSSFSQSEDWRKAQPGGTGPYLCHNGQCGASSNRPFEYATLLTTKTWDSPSKSPPCARTIFFATELEVTLEHLRCYDESCLSNFMQTQLFVSGLNAHTRTYVATYGRGRSRRRSDWRSQFRMRTTRRARVEASSDIGSGDRVARTHHRSRATRDPPR